MSFYKKLLIFMFLCVGQVALGMQQGQQAQERDIKLLVLIIASDDVPVYTELQKIWRSYMHLDREHVEVYFMKGNPHLSQETLVEGDTIWARSPENIVPGIINKTVLSLKHFEPRFREFNYILRTNLSSFYVFPRLLEFLRTLPQERIYCGSSIGDGRIGSGCGFIISPDVAHLLVESMSGLLNNHAANDDVLIGKFLLSCGLRLILHDRPTFRSLDKWHAAQGIFPVDAFHFRIKTAPDRRLTDDVYIQRQLLQLFYQRDIEPVSLTN